MKAGAAALTAGAAVAATAAVVLTIMATPFAILPITGGAELAILIGAGAGVSASIAPSAIIGSVAAAIVGIGATAGQVLMTPKEFKMVAEEKASDLRAVAEGIIRLAEQEKGPGKG